MSVDHNKDKAWIPGNQFSLGSSAPSLGGRLKGRYLIERELGRGGVGVVFLARDERLHGMPVVIKFLLDAAEQNKWLTGKFSQEAEALTRINHPGVVRVIDRDLSDDGRPFFVMEFIKGRPLRDVMNRGTPDAMDLAYVAHLARQIGSALHAAHQQGVFHRDLKPENVMLEQLSGGDEQVKLIDFGIAKVVNPQAGAETEVAVVAGSRQYIAPEQLLSQTASPATDIYALAIIVYEMVTGRLPFNPQGATHFLVMQELMRLQRGESFDKPRAVRPDLPEAAQILLLSALSFNPGRRPQNARIFAEDLAQALMGKINVANTRETAVIPARAHGSARSADEQPATLIDTDENPAPARATDAKTAARTSTPSSAQAETAPIRDGRETSASLKGRKFPIVAGLIILIAVATAAIIAVRIRWPSVWPGSKSGVAQSPSPQTTTPEPASPETILRFNYWLLVRKNPKLYPKGGPSQLPAEIPFAVGDQIHILFMSPQPGHLYIVNESPPIKGQASNFYILFPSPTANQGSSRISAGQAVRIPGHDKGFVFDEEQGAEKVWMIWAAGEVAELENLKGLANPKDAGEIKDAAQIESLRAFLDKRSAEKPQVTQDEASKQTMVRMTGDILVKLVTLQHY
ncbi:MAG TPA: protein kinase [Blastocatellia bacterium]|jgi:serine/threonine-protein kinase|nr:protein kinase [Blastocatellia bacterium]